MEIPFPTPTPPKTKSGGAGAVVSFAIFIICALGVIIFLYYQNQNLKNKLANYQQTPVVVNTLAPTPVNEDGPVIASPSARSKIKSPLTITGTVPAGWMFEGTFPIRLLDSERKIISQTMAKEVEEGSWQSGEPVKFTATLTFKASTGSGALILSNDNPSGLPENDKEFEIPIAF